MLRARLRQRDCFWFLMPGGITGKGKIGSSFKTWATDLPLRINHALGVKICQVGASFGNMSQQHINLWRQRRKFFYVFSPRNHLLQSKFNVESVMDIHQDIEKCLAFYRTVNFVVSNRLHVLLMAASQGARILALTGSKPGDQSSGAKLRGLLMDLGLEQAILDHNQFASDNLNVHKFPGFVVTASQQQSRLRQAFDALLSSSFSNSTNNPISKTN